VLRSKISPADRLIFLGRAFHANGWMREMGIVVVPGGMRKAIGTVVSGVRWSVLSCIRGLSKGASA